MHPGNIFVLADDPAQPRYAAVDFGIVGTLDPRDQRLPGARTSWRCSTATTARVAELHVDPAGCRTTSRVDEMESAMRTICEPIFDRPLKDISFGTVLLRLFEALRRFDGQIQPQLILLQKTLFNIEGLGRQLYPDLDIWQTAGAGAARVDAPAREPAHRVLRELRRGLPDVIEVVKALPSIAKRLVEGSQDRALRLPIDQRAIEELRAEIDAGNRRRDWLLLGGVLLLGGIVWLATGLAPAWVGWLLAVRGLAAMIGGILADR